MKIQFALILSLFSPFLKAEEVEAKIPAMAVKKALQWMLNDDPTQRAAAYRSFQLYGESARDVYRDTLEKAKTLHEKKLGNLLDDDRKNPYLTLDNSATELKSERARIFKLIHTDYQKKGSKISMLLGEVEGLERKVEKIRKLATTKSESLDKSVNTIALALAEVQREILRADGEEISEQKIDSEESLAEALKETFEGETYLKNKSILKDLRQEIAHLHTANTANSDSKWSNSPQKGFTKHLNHYRSVFGLTPFLLEERLSDASVGHSKDMASAGFFSHTSPIEGKTSPADRARLAKFQHRWTGENIYMGSSSPVAAYDAWFASDGHRFIMFAKGPNLIGVGPHGRHWTMMTGKK